jgi:regulator of protease activity HflC (stomatin/prohibitin superfamily)
MKSIKNLIRVAIVLVVLLYVSWTGVRWGVMRVYVPEDKALVVVNKFGDALPPGMLLVPSDDNHYKGVQAEVRGPGRYFLDPVEYNTELVPLTIIPAGDPDKWDWDAAGHLKDPSTAPMIGLVTMKQGKVAPTSAAVVPAGFKGIQEQVLTPGTYKINPYLEEVTLLPAAVVPPGSVGVVTRLIGDATDDVVSTPITAASSPATAPSTQPIAPPSRIVTGANQRGILRNVLQPGVYYINPRMENVTIVPIGYDEISLDHTLDTAVHFYTHDGYEVQADFTVVWGRAAADAPDIVATIGDTERIEKNLIAPAMKAACQNEGSKYTAVELIQGLTRSQFQDDLSDALAQQVKPRHVSILLALVREINIKDTTGNDQTSGLLATIQRANIEVERQITNEQKTATAATEAELQQANKLVDVARETVAAETKVKVANIMANGQKLAAETDANRDLQTAEIQLDVAKLDAQRTQILGKAKADVERMKNEADAKGAALMVQALGTPQAYNQYIFAKNFAPTDLRLIFAGPGTFWTDLKSFQDVGAGKLIQQQEPPPATPAADSNQK